MSAFIVSSDTFDALVTAWDFLTPKGGDPGFSIRRLMSFKFSPEESSKGLLQNLRNMLIKENCASVRCRYPIGYNSDSVTDVLNRLMEIKYSEIGEVNEWCINEQWGYILMLVDCYTYQSCEGSDWKASDSYEFCQSIETQIMKRLRKTIPEQEPENLWGGYKRPVGNPGPISLNALWNRS